MTSKPWFVSMDFTGYLLNRRIPKKAWQDCSASGDVTESVQYWVKKLRFDADPEAARSYLKSFGAWDSDELADHGDNIERLFWSVCCDLKELDSDVESIDVY